MSNAGALFKIKDKLDSDFLLLNVDAVFDVEFKRFANYHRAYGGLVTLFTHPNSHLYDSGLIVVNRNGAVNQWLVKEDDSTEYVKYMGTPERLYLVCEDYREGGVRVKI